MSFSFSVTISCLLFFTKQRGLINPCFFFFFRFHHLVSAFLYKASWQHQASRQNLHNSRSSISVFCHLVSAFQFPLFYHLVSAFLYKASWQHQFSLSNFRFSTILFLLFCTKHHGSINSRFSISVFLPYCFCFSLQSIMAALIVALQFPFSQIHEGSAVSYFIGG